MTQKLLDVWVEAGDGEFVEGHYFAPDSSCFRLEPSDEKCPFCFAALDRVVPSRLFGRIFKDSEQRRGDMTRASVELLPVTHEAFKCSGCEMVLTRVIEEVLSEEPA